MPNVTTKQYLLHKKSTKSIVTSIVCILVVSAFLSANYVQHNRGKVQGVSTSMTAAEIISITNAARQQNGITPLHPQEQLMQAAEAKAKAMIAANAWSHNTPTQTPWQFIDEEGYVYAIAGENLAKGFGTPEEVINAWLASPSHRENLLNPSYTDTGVAVLEGEYQQQQNVLVVQYLAKAYPKDKIASPSAYNSLPIITQNEVEAVSYIGIGFCIAGLCSCILFMLLKQKRSLHKHRSTPAPSFWRR